MLKICYLCGEEILDKEMSKDHVVPKQFIKRAQPKIKGFDYPGFLNTHIKCNNEFGPEKYSQKALKMMQVLQNDKCISIHQHVENPEIRIMAILEECFSEFSKEDLKFFKIIDVRHENYEYWTDPSFLKDKKTTNPRKDVLFIILAVLAKSAAALLLSKSYLKKIPSFWHIIAIPYTGAKTMDFDDLLGQTKPFEKGIKVWINEINEYGWHVIFKAEDVMVFFHFITSQEKIKIKGLSNLFKGDNEERFLFKGNQLNELIDYQWKRI